MVVRRMPGEGDGDDDQLTPGQIWDIMSYMTITVQTSADYYTVA